MTLTKEPTNEPTAAPREEPAVASERPERDPATAACAPPTERVVMYGDFNCPWSYLASRRAAVLAAGGVEIAWRAVEHDAPHGRRATQGSGAGGELSGPPAEPVLLGPLLEEMQQVLTLLLPGEELPYALAGFASHTGAAVAAYAEAYRAGAAALVRPVLFEALWLHGLDLGDPRVVHTLIVDAVRSGASDAGLSAWDYGTGVTFQAGATTQRLLDTWATEWAQEGNRTVPTLVADEERIRGVDAVRWLGEELLRRGLLSGGAPPPARPTAYRPSRRRGPG